MRCVSKINISLDQTAQCHPFKQRKSNFLAGFAFHCLSFSRTQFPFPLADMGSQANYTISLADGDLTLHGKTPVLTKVPQHVSLTSNLENGLQRGAFLGVTADQSSSRIVLPLGILRGNRFLCSFRFMLWWMTYKMGSRGREIPMETQFLLLESQIEGEADLYTLFLPLLDGAFRASLQGNEQDELEICLESGDPAVQTSQALHSIYISTGSDPYEVIAQGFRDVEAHLKTFRRREEKKLPGFLDWFGWCTWDAFHRNITLEGILEGLECLTSGGTPPRFFIIDDGWQTVATDTHTHSKEIEPVTRVVDIKENLRSCKKTQQSDVSLQHLIKLIKDKYKVKYVYMWHTILGSWGGVAIEKFQPSLVFPVHSPGVLRNDPKMAKDWATIHGISLVNPNKVLEFYNEQHSYLSSVGVDGLKVDGQSILETVGAGYGGRVKLVNDYHRALDESIACHFPDDGCIACMSHHTDSLYSSQRTAVMRASDDFWPGDPASHTIHICTNAYNSLFLGEIMLPDWDMFHSRHLAAEFHAAARAVSGSPVYVSDKPGEHDFVLLKKLVLPDGSVLRAELPGRPTLDCLFVDPARDGRSLLKIWNINQFTGILGVFNCQGSGWCNIRKIYQTHEAPTVLSGNVQTSDVHLVRNIAYEGWNGDAIIYSHQKGELAFLQRNESLSVTLVVLGWDIFTIVPIKILPSEVSFAPIGLLNMLNSGGAIRALEYNGLSIKMEVQGCGQLGSYCSREPKSCFIDSKPTELSYNSTCGLIIVELPAATGERQLRKVRIEI